jgi:hypothetical protein
MKKQLLLIILAGSLSFVSCSTSETFVTETKLSYRPPNAIGETYWAETRAYRVDPNGGPRKKVIDLGAGHIPSRGERAPTMLWGSVRKKTYELETDFTEGREQTHATTELKVKNFLGMTIARTTTDHKLPPKAE